MEKFRRMEREATTYFSCFGRREKHKDYETFCFQMTERESRRKSLEGGKVYWVEGKISDLTCN
ncbi:hypothetical protein TSUD_54910 [Trifolium subterraneum]|uniref:Uncharacterized protein n=1 Tax=Trifolium subterraneum TaxID=3900 RepID=A0A2Z6MXJ2_TRISU|nr:hypothetical protein TSUD_54910 [Trifolium subterraneum]